jgi:hypothetical protein
MARLVELRRRGFGFSGGGRGAVATLATVAWLMVPGAVALAQTLPNQQNEAQRDVLAPLVWLGKAPVPIGEPLNPYGIVFDVAGSVSSTQNIQVGNGNFNDRFDATGPRFDGTLSAPLAEGFLGANTFQARVRVSQGSDSQNLSGNAGTFVQANGQTQPINLDISSGVSSSELMHWGAEALFLYQQWLGVFGFAVSPLFGVGFEHINLQTRTSVDIAGLNFRASDMRTVKTNTASLIVGVIIENPVLPLRGRDGAADGGLSTFLELRGNMNFNWADAMAIYDTAQVGVFAELLRNRFSANTITWGGSIGAGVGYTAPNGSRWAIKAEVASVPVHELRFHAGQMANIEYRSLLDVTVGGKVTIPFRTGAPWPFRGVAPIRDYLRQRERMVF